jgi:hypothetical protein
MKRTLALISGLLIFCAANAQAVEGAPKKLALVSLIGDEMSIVTYRPRVGTGVDANHQETIALAAPVFDHAALLTAQSTLNRLLPDTSIAPLVVPAAGSDFDPARVLADGKVAPSNPLIAALRQNDYTHLLPMLKHRAPAMLQLPTGTVGTGYLKGLGFYVDHDLRTKNPETCETGRGFVAPYAYIKLVLLDLATLEIRGEQVITASATRSAARSQSGAEACGAMTAEEKLAVLKSLIEERVAASLVELLRSR